MKYEVVNENNFCRVFMLPSSYPEGYCYAGCPEVSFKMVDWFNPVDMGDMDCIILKEVDLEELIEKLRAFVKRHDAYYKKDRKFIVITNFGLSFIV